MWIPKGAARIRGRRLFEARRLLQEIEYFYYSCVYIPKYSYIHYFYQYEAEH